MKNKKTLILGSITLVLAIFLAASLWYKNQEAESFTKEVSKKQSMLERDHSPTLGPDDAKVTLVEFLDPECESCRAFYPFVKELMAKHPNDIRLVVRYAPFHGNSKFAIKILEAARKQNKYWEALGVEQVKKDLDDPKVVKLIEIDSQDVKDLGVRATPSFFVNGKPLTEFGFNQLESLIESELK